VRAAPLIAILCVAALAQDPPRRIGSIDFYGYAGLNLEQIRSALPLHVGDQFPGPFETLEAVNKAVSSVIGRPPAGVSPVCCDAQGNYMIYIFPALQSSTSNSIPFPGATLTSRQRSWSYTNKQWTPTARQS
jgi:hypothetical protein